jgi:hypothetical protein
MIESILLVPALALLATASGAQAAPPPPVRPPVGARIEIGAGVGGPLRSSPPLPAQGTHGVDAKVRGLVGELFVRYDHPVLPWFSIEGTVMFAPPVFLFLDPPATADYIKERLDLGVAARLRPPRMPRLRAAKLDAFLTLPLGLSRSFIQAPRRRALDEDDQPELGWYAGAGLGGGLSWPSRGVAANIGFFFQVAYLRRTGALRVVYTPHDHAEPEVTERNAFADRELHVSLGGVIAF